MAQTIKIEKYYPTLPAMQKKYDKLARKDRFTGTTQADFAQWRAEARARLRDLLGMDCMEPCDLQPRLLERVDLPGGIVREKVLLQTEPDVYMPVYILIPTQKAAAYRVFLCPPGHQGAGKYSVAGDRTADVVAESIDFFNYDYGLQLAQRGHIALCPDCRGFGERRDPDKQSDRPEDVISGTCYQLAHMAEPLGMTVIGMLVWDLQRLIDYAAQRGEWPMERLSCLGFSGGGMQTLWLSALDDRVQLAVISGYLYGYKDSLLTLCGNCSCNYVPKLWLHYDMGDIASLIAPRPLVIQSCRGDHLNGPRGLQNVLEPVAELQKVYALYHAEGRLRHDICEGEHHFDSAHIFEAIDAVLCAPRRTVVVAADGSGDFATLTEAVQAQQAAPAEPVRFYLKKGVYRERPFIELDNYCIEGESRTETVLTAGVGGFDPWPGEAKTGTFRSQTLFLGGRHAEVRTLTVANTAGDGAKVGQAVAVYADAAEVYMENVTLLGNQDTLFTAPLPEKEREPNGFRGPRQDAPRLDTRQYYLNCTIQGNIDFIFGGANAVFDRCRIVPKAHKSVVSYIAAPSTPAGKPGYIFTRCTVQGDCPKGSVYLGRPWRQDAACYWMDCTLSEEIAPAGWDNWNDPANEKTARFGEYHSIGGAAVRAFGSVDDAEEYRRQCKNLAALRGLFEVKG